MLKACFECLGGSLRDDRHNSTQNGGDTIAISESRSPTVQAPPWPVSRNNSNMYLVPKQLNTQDIIQINGSMNDSYQSLVISFLGANEYNNPDEENVISQLDVNINERGDFESIEPNIPIHVNDQKFQVMFRFLDSEVVVFEDSSSKHGYATLDGEPSLIRFISIAGDVDKISELRFIFQN